MATNTTYLKSKKSVLPDIRIIAVKLADQVYNDKITERIGMAGYEPASSCELLGKKDEHLLNGKKKEHLLNEKSDLNNYSGYQVQLYKYKEEKKLPTVNGRTYPRYIIAFAGTEWSEEVFEKVNNALSAHTQEAFSNSRQYENQAMDATNPLIQFHLFGAAYVNAMSGMISSILDAIIPNRVPSLADVLVDITSALGFETTQYNHARELGAALDSKDVLFTGHSLGGGLAACAASQNPNTTAITFDAMGVPRPKLPQPSYIEQKYNLPPQEKSSYIEQKYGNFKPSNNYKGPHTSNIENYHNNLDFLTCLQEALDIATKATGKSYKAIGTSYNVGPFSKDEIQKHKDLVHALGAVPLKILLSILLLVFGGVYTKLILSIVIALDLESHEIIVHSLKVHDGRERYLLPALQDWINRQEQQKLPDYDPTK